MVHFRNCFALQCSTLFTFCFIIPIGETQRTEMKAIVVRKFGKTSELQMTNVSIPKLSENQVLLKVMAVGINPIDAYIRSGAHPDKPNLPVILGKEVAGVIRKLGQLVKNFEKSDQVFCGITEGGYAEFVIVNATNCYPLPGKLSFSQAAALYVTYFSATRALVQKANVTRDDTVLVHGGKGCFGTAVVQVAKAAGATVVATVSTPEANTLMRKSQADQIVDESKKSYLQMALEKTRKDAFNVIVEINTNANLMNDKKYLAPYGRMVILGHGDSFANEFNTTEPEEGTLIQLDLWKYTEAEQQKAAEFVLNGVEKGWITPVIGRGYRLEDAPLAHDDIDQNKDERGKLVFVL